MSKCCFGLFFYVVVVVVVLPLESTRRFVVVRRSTPGNTRTHAGTHTLMVIAVRFVDPRVALLSCENK